MESNLKADPMVDDATGWRLTLYVAGDTPQSRQAINNLDQVIESLQLTGHSVNVVDLYKEPELAMEKDVLAIPTVIRESPQPVFRIIGDLSDTERVRSMLLS